MSVTLGVTHEIRDNHHKARDVTKISFNYFFFFHVALSDKLYWGVMTKNDVKIASNAASSYSIRRDLVIIFSS